MPLAPGASNLALQDESKSATRTEKADIHEREIDGLTFLKREDILNFVSPMD
jgi:hypothetical protein